MPIDFSNVVSTSTVLKQLISDNPTFLKKITLKNTQDLDMLFGIDEVNFAEYAAKTGDVSLLDAIKQVLPALLTYNKFEQHELVFYAAEAGHLEVLDWLLKNAPDFFEVATSFDPTIAYKAGCDLDYKVLNWCAKNKPDLFRKRLHASFVNHTIGFLSFYRTSKERIENFLDWVKETMPECLVETNQQGLSFAHTAAQFSCMAVFLWIEKNQPELMLATNIDNGSTILHYAAKYGQGEVFIHVLKNNPELAKQLWVLNKDGDTPHTLACGGFNPNAIRDDLLKDATIRVANNKPEATDVRLLVAFQNEWLEFILKTTMYDELLDKVDCFPLELQAALKKLSELSAIKRYKFPENIITRNALSKLIDLANRCLPTSSRVDFFKVSARKNIQLLTELQCLLNSCTTEELDTNHELCLQVLIKDAENALEHQIRTSGSTLHIMMVMLIIKSLEATETVQRLQPRPEVTAEQKYDDVVACFDEFEKKVQNHPLSEGTKETMQEVFLPGLKKLIFEQEQIIEAISKKPNELYMLHEKLPLHTDHNTVDGAFNAAEYRITLKRLVTEVFAAATMAYQKGGLGNFCDQLSSGYCFEGRVRDAFQWVVSCEDATKKFEDRVSDILQKEYFPYAEKILGFSEDEIYSVRNALRFIVPRHYNLRCMVDSKYAPEGKIVLTGLKEYLKEVHAFEGIPSRLAVI